MTFYTLSTGLDDNDIPVCRVRASVRWITNVVKPIFSAPLITARTESDGSRRIALATITGSVVVLDADGQVLHSVAVSYMEQLQNAYP